MARGDNLYAINKAYRLVNLGKDMLQMEINLAFIVRFYRYAEHSDVNNMCFNELTGKECNMLDTTSRHKIQCIEASHLGILATIMKLKPDYKGKKELKHGQAFGVSTTGSLQINSLDVSSSTEEQIMPCVIDIFENAIAKELGLPAGSTVTVTSIDENGVAEYDIVTYTESSAEADTLLAADSVTSALSRASTLESITESVILSSKESSDPSIQNTITASTSVDSHTAGGSRKKSMWSKDQKNRALVNRLKTKLTSYGVKNVHRVREDGTEPNTSGFNSEHRETDVYYFAQESQKDLFVSDNLEAVEQIRNVNGSDKSINNKKRARWGIDSIINN